MALVYEKPLVIPTGKVDLTSAVRALCYIGYHVLLCRGHGENFLHVPGGHIDKGETPEQALIREVYEELGRPLLSYQFLTTFQHQYVREHDGVLEIQTAHVFRCTIQPNINEMGNVGKEPRLSCEWHPVTEIVDLNVLPIEIRPLIYLASPGFRGFSNP